MSERLTLPVLPLREVVLFPGVSTPIGAGRPTTLRAIEAALKSDSRLIFAVAQRENVDTVTPGVLYTTGTIAKISQIQRGLGGVQLLLHGEHRGTALHYVENGRYLEAVVREVEDLQALVTATGASRAFGLSSGALVVLRTALGTPALDRVALYEPPLSVDGSVPTDWMARFDREIAAGKPASALVTALKGIGAEPVLGRLPRLVLVPLLAIGARLQGGVAEDDVPIAALIPTQRFDLRVVGEMADTAKDYAALGAQVLLLGGTKSPAYLSVALDELSAVLPHARRISFSGLGHSGAEDGAGPQRVGEALRDFFGAANG